LVKDFPAEPDYRRDLAASYNNKGVALLQRGQFAEAEKSYRKEQALLEQLVADFPAVPSYPRLLALNQSNLGVVFKDLGRREEAEKADRQALTQLQQLAEEHPGVVAYRRDRLRSLYDLSVVLQSSGTSEGAQKAVDELTRAIALAREWIAVSGPPPDPGPPRTERGGRGRLCRGSNARP
jgi:tetratricopeptide (TPR) repeat protein